MDRKARHILLNIRIKKAIMWAFFLLVGVALFFLMDYLIRYFTLK